ELRDVRTLDVAVAWNKLAAKQVLRRDRKRELIVGSIPGKRQLIEIRHGLHYKRIRWVFDERHIAQEGLVVVPHLSCRGPRARHGRGGREGGGMGVEALQIESQGALRIILPRVRSSMGRSDQDLFEVRKHSGSEGARQTLHGSHVR